MSTAHSKVLEAGYDGDCGVLKPRMMFGGLDNLPHGTDRSEWMLNGPGVLCFAMCHPSSYPLLGHRRAPKEGLGSS